MMFLVNPLSNFFSIDNHFVELKSDHFLLIPVWITLLVRYTEIETIIENDKLCQTLSISVETKSRVKASNKISIVISAMVCMSLVAIASVRSGEMFEFHLMVGIPLFAGAPIIHVLQTWISHQMVPAVTSVSTANYRLLLTILCIVCLFLFLAFSLWSYLLFEKDWKTERMRWKSGDAGYVQHVIGNAAEWLYLLSHAFFVLSFSQEFKRLKLYETKFQFELT